VPAIACYIDDHDVLMSWAAPAADPAAVRASLQYRSYAREQWMAANERVMDVEVRHRVWDNALSTLLDEGFQVLHRPGDVNYLRFTDRERHVDWRVAADIVSTIIRRECQGIVPDLIRKLVSGGVVTSSWLMRVRTAKSSVYVTIELLVGLVQPAHGRTSTPRTRRCAGSRPNGFRHSASAR